MYSYSRDENPEGHYPRVLFVCSAGMLRSATAAHLMAGKGWNTRCVGTEGYAIQQVTRSVCDWAEKIICMEKHHQNYLEKRLWIEPMKIWQLGIPDDYHYRDPELEKRILGSLKELGLWEGSLDG